LIHSRPVSERKTGKREMKKNTTENPSMVRVIVEKAFKKTHEDYGVSENDVFVASVAFAGIGLILVNLDWIPASFKLLGWSLMAIGVASMFFIRKIL
jgi:hypothetical protein